MSHVTIPVLFAGLLTTLLLEYTGWFGYGAKLPEVARVIIQSYTDEMDKNRNQSDKNMIYGFRE